MAKTGGRVLVVEDEEGLSISIEDRLRTEGYDVETAANGIDGEKRASLGSYGVVILDVMLPMRNGFQVCQNLRERGVETPILILTARDSVVDTVMGLRIGADDYLTKPFDMQELLARVHALLRRRRASEEAPPSSSIAFGEFAFDVDALELHRGEDLIELSAQEVRLLLAFLRNPDRVLSRDDLLKMAWGFADGSSTRTVDVHVGWLREKLDEKRTHRHLRTVRGLGYRFRLDP